MDKPLVAINFLLFSWDGDSKISNRIAPAKRPAEADNGNQILTFGLMRIKDVENGFKPFR